MPEQQEVTTQWSLMWLFDYIKEDDEMCLRAEHPFYHSEGEPLYYKIYQDNNEWIARFEGYIIYRGKCLADTLLACEQDNTNTQE